MKRILLTALTAGLMVGLSSCSKDADPDPGPLLPSVAEALAEHDTKSGGLYKGTFANATSSGTIKVVLQQSRTEIVLVLNGTSRTLTTTDLSGWTSGDAIAGATFTASDWTIVFDCDADAGSFNITMNLAGDTNFSGTIVKEFSTGLVRVYEGTYAGDSSGKWNFVTQGNLLAGIYYGSSTDTFDGTIAGNAITITSSGIGATGTFTNELRNCTGNWSEIGGGDTGTWSGVRKL